MTEFIFLSPIVRSLFSTWAILLCLCFLGGAVYSLSHFRPKHALASFAMFLLPYYISQTCAGIVYYRLHAEPTGLTVPLVRLPYFIYIIVLAALTIWAGLWLYMSYKYSETHITPKSVKQAADDLPTGLVYYYENGQTYLLNKQMNDLSTELFGHPVLNGRTFEEELGSKDIYETADGRVYRFTKNQISIKNNKLREIIAEEVTELYHKIERLRQDNQALAEHNRRMNQYGQQIAELVKQEEVLKAKARIHDEMNRILLMVNNALKNDTEDNRNRVLRELQTNALLLGMGASPDQESRLSDLYKLAENIGVKIHLENEPKLPNASLLIFVMSAQEALVNAAKHGGAGNFYIDVTENLRATTITFKNDGRPPEGEISLGGGLSNMKESLEKAGGSMKIKLKPEFILTIEIPKEEQPDENQSAYC